MFGLGKTKVTAEEVAVKLMQMVAWTGKLADAQRQQAISDCPNLDQETYDLEYCYLRVFVGVAAARTSAPGNGLGNPGVWDEFIEQYANQFYTYGRQTLKQDGFGDVALERIQMYAEACDPNEPSLRGLGVAKLFSQLCCGDPDNDTLRLIGGSVYLVNGDAIAQALKKFAVRKN